MVKVNANTLRKGNVVDIDSKLYTVLKADNIQPGKGTPVTQLELRRISDGVKTVQSYRTTESVERAFVEPADFTYLFEDGDNYVFMNKENYEQVHVSKDILGDQGVFLHDGMEVILSLHEGNPIAAEIPQRVVLEVVETEPALKGQTATSSFKPALLSNGVRIGVPTHIVTGTKIVVDTGTSSYIERSKE